MLSTSYAWISEVCPTSDEITTFKNCTNIKHTPDFKLDEGLDMDNGNLTHLSMFVPFHHAKITASK